MINDAFLYLSGSPGNAGQAVTATAVSTNTIDLSQARDIGEGEDLYVQFITDVAATAAGAATVRFEVITSASANLGSPTVIVASGDIPKASLTVGARIELEIPAQYLVPLGQRYLGVQYTVSTGPLTAGTFTALINFGHQSGQKSYASGFTVA